MSRVQPQSGEELGARPDMEAMRYLSPEVLLNNEALFGSCSTPIFEGNSDL